MNEVNSLNIITKSMLSLTVANNVCIYLLSLNNSCSWLSFFPPEN
jgi:hypothetical protein